MGKPYGFLKYARELPPDRPVLERLRDWREFHGRMTEEQARTQSARCMDCGTPFCHTGLLMGGTVSGCPLNNLIPEWNDLICRGLWREAYLRLRLTNNFPEFTGRVCPAPCEGSCTLGLNDTPVAIRQNECQIIDRAFDEGWISPRPPLVRTGKKVAVVGSGPAGLACADLLNKAGHLVTIFERSEEPGGLMMFGIPNMKLDKKMIRRRTSLMTAEGVEFSLRTEVGKDYPLDKLKHHFDAAVLCCGAAKPRDLKVEGRGLAGIHFAVEYLGANTRRILGYARQDAGSISANGRHVVVIGGGDTGTDCVATALRQGCLSVVQFEIVARPPDRRRIENPWPQWPRVYRADYGQEEAAALQGSDPRIFSLQTVGFSGDSQGRVREVRTVEVEWTTDNGRSNPRAIPGTEKTWPAQIVLLAMGFLGPEDDLLEGLCIERDERSNARAAEGVYATNIEGIYAAGDMRRGQSLVAWAIKEGRGAAREVDRYLRGPARFS